MRGVHQRHRHELKRTMRELRRQQTTNNTQNRNNNKYAENLKILSQPKVMVDDDDGAGFFL